MIFKTNHYLELLGVEDRACLVVVCQEMHRSLGNISIKFRPCKEILLSKGPVTSCSAFSRSDYISVDISLGKDGTASVKFGGFLVLDRQFRGKGIGTWIMVTIFRLVQSLAPEGVIYTPLRLDRRQAGPERDAFYRGLGLDVQVDEAGYGMAHFSAPEAFRQEWNQDKVKELDLAALLERLDKEARINKGILVRYKYELQNSFWFRKIHDWTDAGKTLHARLEQRGNALDG